MSSIADRLLKGSLWLTLARAIVNGLSMVSTVVLAWYLVPEDFGLVAIATTLMVIANSVTQMSLGQALIRHDDPGESHFSAAWTLGATRGVILALLFASAAYPVASLYGDPRLIEIMLALSLGLVISGLGNPRRIMLQRQLIFWQEFTLNVSQKLVGFVVTVAVAAIYQSYWALVLGILAFQLTSLIVSYTVLPFRPRITFRHFREFFAFSGWLTAGQIVNVLNWRVEHLLIAKFLGAAPLGYYTVGNTISTLPTREATAPLTQTIYPGFAKVRGDRTRLAAAYQRAQALLTAIALPAGVGVAVIAEPLVLLLMGEKWAPIIFIVQALASVFAFQTLGSLVQPLGMATGDTRMLFVRDTQMLVVRLPIIVASLLLWGLPGVVYARVFTGCLATFVNMLLVRRLIGVTVSRQLAANARALISVSAMAISVWATLEVLGPTESKLQLAEHVALLVVTGALVYVATSFLLWLVMRRPDGPEIEIHRLVRKVLSKARRVTLPGAA